MTPGGDVFGRKRRRSCNRDDSGDWLSCRKFKITMTPTGDTVIYGISPPVGKLLLSCDSERGRESSHESAGTTAVEEDATDMSLICASTPA